MKRLSATQNSSGQIDFIWELDLDSETEIDETDYLVTFEILQVTNGHSAVQRVSHSCTGPAACSATTTIPLPALPVRGFGLASFVLETSVTNPALPGPVEVMADVTQFAVSPKQVDSTMSCKFDRWGGTATCRTEAILIATEKAEAAEGHVSATTLAPPTYAPSTASGESPLLLTDSIRTSFRLCGQERFRLFRYSAPNPPPPVPPGGFQANDTTYSMWAGAADGEQPCGAGNPTGFTGAWWYFYGSTGFPSGPPVWFNTGVSSGISYDEDASILATKFD